MADQSDDDRLQSKLSLDEIALETLMSEHITQSKPVAEVVVSGPTSVNNNSNGESTGNSSQSSLTGVSQAVVAGVRWLSPRSQINPKPIPAAPEYAPSTILDAKVVTSPRNDSAPPEDAEVVSSPRTDAANAAPSPDGDEETPKAPVEKDFGACPQFYALMKKNVLIKRRAWLQTMLETTTPILLLSLLIFARSLSSTYSYPSEIYVNRSIPWVGLMKTLESALPTPVGGNSSNVIWTPTGVRIEKNALGVGGWGGYCTCGDGNSYGAGDNGDGCATIACVDGKPGKCFQKSDPEWANRRVYCNGTTPLQYRTNNDFLNLINQVVEFPGAVPVMPLDLFAQLCFSISDLLGTSDVDNLARLQTIVFRGKYGSLLNLGKLVFASKTQADAPRMRPRIDRLVQYMNRTFRTFGRLFDRVFDSEEEAIAATVQKGQRRTWAVVVFDELERGRFDYTIRMNDTIVPSTKSLWNKWRPYLDKDYQRYYWSGFLSLQNALDEYHFTLFNDTHPNMTKNLLNLFPFPDASRFGANPRAIFFTNELLDAFQTAIINATNVSECQAASILLSAADSSIETQPSRFDIDRKRMNQRLLVELRRMNPGGTEAEAEKSANELVESIVGLTETFRGTIATGAGSALDSGAAAAAAAGSGPGLPDGISRKNAANLNKLRPKPFTTPRKSGGEGKDKGKDTGKGTTKGWGTPAPAAGPGLFRSAAGGFTARLIDPVIARILLQSISQSVGAVCSQNSAASLSASALNAQLRTSVVDGLDSVGRSRPTLGPLSAGRGGVTLPPLPNASEALGRLPFNLGGDQPSLRKAYDSMIKSVADVLQPFADSQHHPLFMTAPMPRYQYKINYFYQAVGPLMGLLLSMSTLYPVSRFLKLLVDEKESRAKETMKIMGLKESMYILTWYLTFTAQMFVVAAGTAFVVSYFVLPRSSPTLLFCFFFIFCLSEICFAFLVASFFSRAKLAAIVGPIMLFVLVLPRFILQAANEADFMWLRVAMSVLSPCAFAFGADRVSEFEAANIGLTWSLINQGRYPFSLSLAMMAADAVVYMLFGLYFDQVLPRKYGIVKPWYFLCQCCCAKKRQNAMDPELTEGLNPDLNMDNREPVPPHLNCSMSCRNLVKTFKIPGGKKVAINNLNVDIMEGQITALLGHNGAGKTTTISVLTGLIAQTSGKVTILGNDIEKNMDLIRKIIGVCPQHNVLFENMTCLEHLELFAVLKGVPAKHVAALSLRMCRLVGLSKKANSYAHNMSGGQKRKLSVGIALMAGSRVVFLDEPTSGMDPYSRRDTWRLLQSARANCALVLTTHFMDEADILGDRIAIMSAGQIKCLGTSLFLKARFGIGYQLCMVKSQNSPRRGRRGSARSEAKSNAAAEEKVDNRSVQEQVEELIEAHVPDYKLLSNAGDELAFQLPMAAVPEFADLFSVLERDGDKLGLSGFGVSMTTLEEVFLRLNEECHNEDEMSKGCCWSCKKHKRVHADPKSGIELASTRAQEDLSALASPRYVSPTLAAGNNNAEGGASGPATRQSNKYVDADASAYNPWTVPMVKRNSCRMLGQLLLKRWLIFKRDIKSIIFTLFCPLLVVMLVMLILIIELFSPGPSLRMDFSPMASRFTPEETPEHEILNSNMPGVRWPLTGEGWVDETLPDLIYTPDGHVDEMADPIRPMQTQSAALDKKKFPPLPDNFGLVHLRPPTNLPDTVDLNYIVPAVLQSSLKDLVGDVDLELLFPTMESPRPGRDRSNQASASSAFQGGKCPDGTPVDTSGARLCDGEEPGSKQNSLQLSQYLLQTYMKHKAPRFGAYAVNDTLFTRVPYVHPRQVGKLIGKVMSGQEVDPSALKPLVASINSTQRLTSSFGSFKTQVTILHNTSTRHAIPMFMSEMTRHILKKQYNISHNPLICRQHPLPLTKYEDLTTKMLLSIVAALFLLIPFSYVPASFSMFVVQERMVKSKHLQVVSGVNLYVYWFSTYIWDLGNFFLISVSSLLVMAAFREENYVGTLERAMCVLLLLMLYGASSTALSYVMSFMFKSHSAAQVGIAMINFVTGFVAVLAAFIMDFIEETKEFNKLLKLIYRIFPQYNLGEGMVWLGATNFQALLGQKPISPWKWDVTGRNLWYCAVEAVCFFSLTLIIDSNVFSWFSGLCGSVCPCSCVRNVDTYVDHYDYFAMEPDVKAEMQRIDATPMYTKHSEDPNGNRDVILMRHLRKVWPPKGGQSKPNVAVRNMTLAIRYGECFGFLGVNGAGKTTSMSMLTGEIPPSSGGAQILGYDIQKDLDTLQQHLGYCPQFDPLLGWMTARETLSMFARIKGVKEEHVAKAVEEAMRVVTLTQYADRTVQGYSGGNKRKLSLAIALIGGPTVVFLDEPSTGMDPVARRKMWDVICATRESRSIVLTTHSMEECEALCSRLGIMVGGRLRCVGGIQELKARYGQGYYLEVTLRNELNVPAMHAFVQQEFPGSQQRECYSVYLRYFLPSTSSDGAEVKLSSLFKLLELRKHELDISDYSVSQPTLEQVFIDIARKSEQDDSRELVW